MPEGSSQETPSIGLSDKGRREVTVHFGNGLGSFQ